MSLIRGWVCAATRVEVSIDDGLRLPAAYGTERLDTASVCGDTNNGFGLTYNWSEIGDGVHTLKAFADGVEFANINFVVTTLGGKFLTGLRGEYTVPNFPASGRTATLRWSQAHQNFVLVSPITISPVSNPPARPGAMLESPTQGSSESGVGLIRGWVCQAGRVEVSIDGGPRLATAYGTDRPDTAGACGDTNNGFGLTYNWNRSGNGAHNLRAFADGVEFANVNFAVTTLGGEFLTGLSGKLRLLDFPNARPAAVQPLADSGPTTTVEWSEPHQNFLIATTTATGQKLALVSAITDARNRFAVLGVGATPASQATTTGVQVVKDTAGEPTQITGVTWADTQSGGWADLLIGSDSLPATYRDSNGGEARLSNYTTTGVEVRFFDPAGRLLAGPVTASLNGDLVRKLQELALRVQQTATSTPARSAADATGIAPQASTATLFSLKPLLAEMLGTGSTAAGELLCALQRAASTTGVGNLVAPTACRSPLLQGFLALAATAQVATAQTTAAGGLNPALRQALEFDSDVAPIPCDPASASTACLTPAATELQARVAEPIPELPWQAPPTPPTPVIPEVPSLVEASDGTFPDWIRITWTAVANTEYYDLYRDGTLLAGHLTDTLHNDQFGITPGQTYSYTVRACNSVGCSADSRSDTGYAQPQQHTHSYSGTRQLCFTATANFGVQGTCSDCGSGSAQITLQNGSLLLNAQSWSYSYNFDSRGNCTTASVTLEESTSSTFENAYANGSIFFSFNVYTSDGGIYPVNIQGSYNDTVLSASGSVSYDSQLSNGIGSVNVVVRHQFSLQSP